MLNEGQNPPVRKSVAVRASAAQAFSIFTEDFDSWWPRSHHIGSAPMRKAIIENRLGGRCYSEHVDGTECDWGTVLAWEPPHRLVIAWQMGGDWKYEPDISKSSEVEIRFSPAPEGMTLVSLEHRYLDRAGPSAGVMRASLDSANGWGGILQLFDARVAQHEGLTSNTGTERS
jgi:uncharacterized protein YndB with AHSA1/START domain